MTPTPSTFRRALWPLLLALALAGTSAWLALRSAGLQPMVFADEMLYSLYARLAPLSEAAIPSYLYFALYRLTSLWGDAFLDAARALNIAFLAGAAPFLYLLARRFVAPPLAVLVVLLSVCAPFNSFTAYFMPETMYFFAFYVLTWAVFSGADRHWATQAALMGAVLGVMAMIKIHALFLIPALGLYAACTGAMAAAGTRRYAAAGLVVIGAALAVKFGVGYAIGGAKGLQLFGSFYGPIADDTARQKLWPLLAPGWINLRGHLLALALCFGVPMAVLAQSLASRKARAEAGLALTQLHVYTVLVLGASLAMTVAYTASIAGYGQDEGLRLHQRYYDFTFPLLYLVAAAACSQAWHTRARWPLAGSLAIACLLALYKLPTYRLVMIDTPEIASLFAHRGFALTAGLAGAFAVALWAWRQRSGAIFYLLVLVPALAVQGALDVTRFQQAARAPKLFDTAGKYVHDTVPAAERGAVMVAGSNLGDLMRVKFHIDARDVTLYDMPPGSPFDVSYLPVRKKWLLLVGEHALPPSLTPVAQTAGFALVRVGALHERVGSIAFNGVPYGELVAGVQGLSFPEWWGRWSDAKEVVIRFRKPLPKRLSVVLTAQAYGPNAGQQFIARVGDAERRFVVGGAAADIYLPFDTDGRQDTLRIVVPQPVTPSQVTNPGDRRTIGLGLANIEIGTAGSERP